MIEKAYAKINLSLNINGKRNDGYHTLESIFLPIMFYDLVEINKNDEMIYECNKGYIHFNELNTVVRAINLMKEEFSITDNFKVVLTKHIPTKAGIGGGSSDAAAVIRIFNQIYNLNLNDVKIRELCLKIGADVLFTYYSKPALVTGIGDNIEFINVKKYYYVLLVKPRFGVSTKDCYSKLNIETCCHPNIISLRKALESGDDFIPYLGNSMEQTAIALLKEIEDVKKLLLELGAPFALMSGSGSTVFTMSEDYKLICRLNNICKEKGFFVRATKVIK